MSNDHDQVIAMINARLDRIESKLDSALEFKWTLTGKMSVWAMGAAVVTTLLVEVVKAAIR